jgi:ribosomal subunit interface protein
MRIETRWRNIEPIRPLEEAISKRAERLKRTIGRFDPERGGVELTVQVEHSAKRELYEISGNLHLTNHISLFAREQGHDVLAAIGATFDELARQVRKLKSRYASTKKSGAARGAASEPEGTGAEDNEEAGEEPEQTAAGPDLEVDSMRLDRERLGRLARTIHRELRYQLALQDLREDQVNPVGILDEAIAAAIPRLQEQRRTADSEVVLVQEAMAAVQRRVGELVERRTRDDLSTNASVPAEEKLDRLEAATESYLAPLLDESLCFEDLLPNPGASPEDVASTLELEERIDRLLTEFPQVVRNVFLLSTLENLSPEQVGEVLHINEEAVRTHLSSAREAVRHGLEPEMSPSLRRLFGLENHPVSTPPGTKGYSSVAKEL